MLKSKESESSLGDSTCSTIRESQLSKRLTMFYEDTNTSSQRQATNYAKQPLIIPHLPSLDHHRRRRQRCQPLLR